MITALQATSVVKTFASQFEDAGFTNFTVDPLADKTDSLLNLYNSLSPDVIVSLVNHLQPFQFLDLHDDCVYVFLPLGLFHNVILELRAHGPVIWYQFRYTNRSLSLNSKTNCDVEYTNSIPIQYGFLETSLALPSSIKFAKTSEISSNYISKVIRAQSSLYKQDIQNIVNSVLDLDSFKSFMSGMSSNTEITQCFKNIPMRLQRVSIVVQYLAYLLQSWSQIMGTPTVPAGVKYKGKISDLMYILLIYCMYEDQILANRLIEFIEGKY